MNTTLVLGGTGTTGRRIARRLREAGHPVRTASRTGGDVRCALGEPSTWAAALDGVAGLYVLEPDLRTGLDPSVRIPGLVEAAAAAGVRRVVLLSAHGVGEADDGRPLKGAEDAVRASGMDWTILRPGWFAQNFSETFWRPAVLTGTLALPTGDGRTAFVDADDIAEVAAAALTDVRHAGRIYQLTGPRSLGFAEAVEIIGKATGRTVRHVDVTAEAFVEQQVAHGVAPDVAARLCGLLVAVRDGLGSGVSDGVREALGRPARGFEQFVAGAVGAWSESDLP
ncbi:NAD(P)H-binding protein [Yinghuangia aomiensis]